MFAEKPHKDIYNFVGNFTMVIAYYVVAMAMLLLY